MGKLTDILGNGNGDAFRRMWDSTAATSDLGPLPSGTYIARILSGEVFKAKTKGTPGYKLTLEVLEGPQKGCRFWHDLWLTQDALPRSKGELGKLGITSPDQLEKPIPKGIRCEAKVVLRRADDGAEFNAVKSFEVVGIDAPEPNPFAPAPESAGPLASQGVSDQREKSVQEAEQTDQPSGDLGQIPF